MRVTFARLLERHQNWEGDAVDQELEGAEALPAEIRLLGPLRVRVDGTSIPIQGARLRTLTARLALDAGRPVSPASLTEAVWPDGDIADPRHALQSLVSRLRRVLTPVTIRSTTEGYVLGLSADRVDALRFEALVEQGRRGLRRGQRDLGLTLLGEALALWDGDPLAAISDTPYGASVIARLEELRLVALEERLAIDLVTSPADVASALQEAIATHPLRERLRVLQVRALHADGRPAEALDAYANYRDLLRTELGVDPGPELRDAHLATLRHPDGDGPPVASRGNLPATWTTFVGREREQDELRAALAQARLVLWSVPVGQASRGWPRRSLVPSAP